MRYLVLPLSFLDHKLNSSFTELRHTSNFTTAFQEFINVLIVHWNSSQFYLLTTHNQRMVLLDRMAITTVVFLVLISRHRAILLTNPRVAVKLTGSQAPPS